MTTAAALPTTDNSERALIATEPELTASRDTIRGLLKESRHLEYPELVNNTATIRMFRMTKEEFEAAKPFTVTMLLGKLCKEQVCREPTEGFCYDIRTLVRLHYLRLNATVAYVPIPLSKRRWNQLVDRHGAAYISNYTRTVGILEYPLLYEELQVVLRTVANSTSSAPESTEEEGEGETIVHLKEVPVVCVGESEGEDFILGCKFASLEALREFFQMIEVLYDTSPTKRFGPPEKSLPKKMPSIPSSLYSVTAPLDEESAKKMAVKIRDATREELRRHDLLYPVIDQRLSSPKTMEWILDRMKSGETPGQIHGTLVNDTIRGLTLNTPTTLPIQKERSKPKMLASR